MPLLPAIGGMGAATIAGTFFNKLTPAAIMWLPQGSRVEVEPTPENQTNSATSGSTQPHGINDLAPIVDKVDTGVENENFSKAKSLIFHCASVESFSVASTVTKFPVDSGFSVSDHTIRQNPIIQIEGVVSNTTMSPMDLLSLGGIIQVGGAILGTPLAGVLGSAIGLGQALAGDSQKADADFFHEELEKLVREGQLVQVSTLRGLYENCIITSYSTRADVDTSSSLHFSITLEKLYVVNALGEVTTQTNKALVELPTLGASKISGYMNAIGIGAVGTIAGAL